MTKLLRKMTAGLLCAVTLFGASGTFFHSYAAETLRDEDWTLVGKTPAVSGMGSTQGLAVGDTYLYSAQVNGNNNLCAILRVHRDTGKTDVMSNAKTGTKLFSGLGHANDMDVLVVDGREYLFILSTSNLIVFEVDDTKMLQKAKYKIKSGGSDFTPGSFGIYSSDEERITFLFKTGNYISRGGVSAGSVDGDISVTSWFMVDAGKVELDGKVQDYNSFLNQAMFYKDNTLYIVKAGCEKVETVNQSIILGYDISSPSGTVQPDLEMIFFVESSKYPALFEAEDCGISSDGKLYFNTNGRRSASDTDHDGIFRLNEYTFVPSADRKARYIVKYNANGADGYMSSHTFPLEGEGILPTCAFVTEDKHFDGWTVRRSSDRKNLYVNVSDPTETVWLGKAKEGYELYRFAPGDGVQGLTDMEEDTIVFAAAWSLYGDINGDGKLNVSDVVALRLYAEGGYPLAPDRAPAMDVNGDGVVSGADAMCLFAYVAGALEKIPACE